MSSWRTALIWSLANAIQFYSATDFSTLQKSYEKLLSDQIQDFQGYYSLIYSYVLMISIPLSFGFSYLCTRYGVFKPMIGLYCISNLAQVFQYLDIKFNQFANFQGVEKKNVYLIFISRIVYNSAAAQNVIMSGVYVSKNFQKNERSFPSAIIAVLSLSFGGLNNAIAPIIADKYGLVINNFFLLLINFISLILIILAIYMEQRQMLSNLNRIQNVSPPLESPVKDYIIIPLNNEELSYTQIVGKLPFKFYLIVIILTTQFIFSLLIQIIGNIYLQERYKMSEIKAGQAMSYQALLVFGLPFMGKIVDNYSEKSEILVISASLMSLISGCLIIQSQPILGLVLLGQFNCLRIALMFPLLSRHTDCKKTIGVWFGIIKFVENLLGCIIFFIAGDIYHIYGNYNLIIQACVYIAGLGVVVSIGFWLMYRPKKGMEIHIDDLEDTKNSRQIFNFDFIKEKKQSQQCPKIIPIQ